MCDNKDKYIQELEDELRTIKILESWAQREFNISPGVTYWNLAKSYRREREENKGLREALESVWRDLQLAYTDIAYVSEAIETVNKALGEI